MTHTREPQLRQFLSDHGWGDAQRHMVKGDASFRRYERVVQNGKSAILMDAPPGVEDIEPFIAIGRFLYNADFSAPEIYAIDVPNGFMLLEDFGDDVYGALLAEATPRVDEATLYTAAVDVLAKLHQCGMPEHTPAYSDERLLQEASLLTEWYLPHIIHDSTQLETARSAYQEAWKKVLPLAHTLPPVLALRDYHSPNLMWLPERKGIRTVGLLDFQDAVAGSPAYDMVSLLEDARRNADQALAQRLITRYLAASPSINEADFRAAYAMLGAQRNCKIIGFVARKIYRDNTTAYLHLLGRMWRYLAIDLAHPALAPVKHWIDTYIPRDKRDDATLCADHQERKHG